MSLRCLGSVNLRVEVMPVRQLCVMRRLLVVPGLELFCGLAVVAGGVIVMLSGLLMMFDRFLGHKRLL
jgi:hypothetical protein